MGRKTIDKKEKRIQIYASAPTYIVEYLTQKECKKIADNAIEKAYEKLLKSDKV